MNSLNGLTIQFQSDSVENLDIEEGVQYWSIRMNAEILIGILISGLIGAAIGQARGRAGAGLIWGLILGPLGWLITLLGPNYKKRG